MRLDIALCRRQEQDTLSKRVEMVLTAEHKIQGVRLDLDLPSYIDLNLPVSTPGPYTHPSPHRNLPMSTPTPTNLHPLDVDTNTPPGSLFCSEGLLNVFAATSIHEQWIIAYIWGSFNIDLEILHKAVVINSKHMIE